MVYNEDDEKIVDREESEMVLSDLLDMVSLAYVANNNVNGTYTDTEPLLIETFDNIDKLEEYSKASDYVDNMLCFSLGWKAFDKANYIFDLEFYLVSDSQAPNTNQNLQVNSVVAYDLLNF